MSRRNLAEPVTLVRSPIITNPVSPVIVNGSSPDSRVTRPGRAAAERRGHDRTAAAISAMCAGVVPQQPPTMFTMPSAENSCR